jgi:hypothetical protein
MTELSVKIERLNHVQGSHVHAFYIHNVHGWSNFFALFHVTTWMDRNVKTINYHY